ncbi:hypothetical protein [Rugosimonospora africana]|uniref:Uncharacterized protein n=1 Tax=Rugosimonospora africana TaxID=556532 RepID=A0A8J3QVF3_9ACTN|nr:hypothetical protein [Rugosimonospora africana]GIH17206.1 hypothetical protein Raf01_53780 [Rugosimonospora africana]
MTIVYFHVLDVGQGMGNYVEITDNAGRLQHTVLADLGSTNYREEAGYQSVEKVYQSLVTMDQPTIDVLFLSHSDEDHHNLLAELFSYLDPYTGQPDKKTLHIARVIYGGQYGNYDKRGTNILDEVQRYTYGRALERVADGFSSFGETIEDVKPMVTLGDVDVYIILGNQAAPEKTSESVRLNTVSLVLLVTLRGDNGRLTAFVATGDATGHTIVECNPLLTLDVMQRFLSNVLVLTAPHHGARNTLFDLRGFTEETARDNAEEFYRIVHPRCIAASAEKSKYSHPAVEVLLMAWPHLEKTPLWWEPEIPQYHMVTSHIPYHMLGTATGNRWPAYDDYYSMFANANIYTTLYSFAQREPWTLSVFPMPAAPAEPMGWDPPTAVIWIFIASDTGAVTVQRWTNRQNLDVALREWLAVPPAPVVAPREPVRPLAVRVFP